MPRSLTSGGIANAGLLAVVVAAPLAAQALVSSQTIYMESGKAKLDGAARETLDVIAKQAGDDNIRIMVTGHTDRSASNAKSTALSLERAQIVADYLVSKGIPARRILTGGMGALIPAVATADGVKEPRNNRVVIEVRRF